MNIIIVKIMMKIYQHNFFYEENTCNNLKNSEGDEYCEYSEELNICHNKDEVIPRYYSSYLKENCESRTNSEGDNYCEYSDEQYVCCNKDEDIPVVIIIITKKDVNQ